MDAETREVEKDAAEGDRAAQERLETLRDRSGLAAAMSPRLWRSMLEVGRRPLGGRCPGHWGGTDHGQALPVSFGVEDVAEVHKLRLNVGKYRGAVKDDSVMCFLFGLELSDGRWAVGFGELSRTADALVRGVCRVYPCDAAVVSLDLWSSQGADDVVEWERSPLEPLLLDIHDEPRPCARSGPVPSIVAGIDAQVRAERRQAGQELCPVCGGPDHDFDCR